MTAVPVALIYLVEPWVLLLFLPAGSPSTPIAMHINAFVLWGFIPFGMAFIFAGVPISAPPFLLRAMLADLTDAQDLDGRRRGESAADTTGLNYAILTATQKLGYAIPVGLTYPILGLIGFDPTPGATNSSSAIEGLTFLFVFPPLLLGALAAWLIWRWPITAEVHARIRAELAQTAPNDAVRAEQP